MILTENATYLHMPRTGGTWVRNVLRPITIEEYDHKLPNHPSANIFTFVRNPWAWHVSTYHAIVFGSDIAAPCLDDPVIAVHGTVPTFAEFVQIQINPTAEYKRKLLSVLKITKSSESSIQIAEQWIDNDKGWYQLMCDNFLKYATVVGRYEALSDDLTYMMSVAGDHAALSVPKINVGNMVVDYRMMYSYELAQMVNAACRPMIEQFYYDF